MRHSSFLKAFCAGSMLTVLAGCSASSGVPDKGKLIDTVPKRLTYQTAPNLEQALAPENRREGIVNDPAVSAYPQQIVDTLLDAWDGTKPLSVTVYLTPSTEFAAEDTSQFDTLFLSAGTIGYAKDNLADTPEALVFGLAHELAHVLLRHSAAQRGAQEKKNYLFAAEKWASIGMAMAGGGDAGAMLFGGIGGKALIDSVIFSQWTRAQEETADALAVDLMVKAGYDIGGATALLDALTKEEGRIEEENKAKIAKAGQVEYHSDSVNIQSKSDNLVGDLLVGTLNGLQKTHPDAKDRAEKIKTYINNNYGKVAATQSIDDSFAKWSRSRVVSVFVNDAKILGDASVAFQAKDWRGVKRILAKLSPVGRNNVTAIFYSAAAESHTGNVKGALTKIDQLSERDDVTEFIVEQIGLLLKDVHRYPQAEAYLEKEEKAFNTHSFIPYRILNGRVSGDKDLMSKADELSLKCEALGDDALEKLCLAFDHAQPENQQKK